MADLADVHVGDPGHDSIHNAERHELNNHEVRITTLEQSAAAIDDNHDGTATGGSVDFYTQAGADDKFLDADLVGNPDDDLVAVYTAAKV